MSVFVCSESTLRDILFACDNDMILIETIRES